MYGILIYAYVLMDSHPHLIIKMSDKVEFSRFMQRVHSEFAQKLNRKLKRKGHVVMDRPKTPVVENENYLTNLMFYLDLNPFKTMKPKHPATYKFSSYHFYAFGKDDPLLDISPIYIEMGHNQKARQKAYHDMVEDLIAGYITKKQLQEFEHIEKATCYFGSPDFVKREHKKLLERLKIRRKNRGKKRSFDPPWNSIK